MTPYSSILLQPWSLTAKVGEKSCLEVGRQIAFPFWDGTVIFFRGELLNFSGVVGSRYQPVGWWMMLAEPIRSISSSNPRRNFHQIRLLNRSCRPPAPSENSDSRGKSSGIKLPKMEVEINTTKIYVKLWVMFFPKINLSFVWVILLMVQKSGDHHLVRCIKKPL